MSSRPTRRPVYVKPETVASNAVQQNIQQLEAQTAKLQAKLAYAESYLKMIDEAIAVEGFTGWNPPT
jgi:hypothetical protein